MARIFLVLLLAPVANAEINITTLSNLKKK
jgi:hypothetical protein